MSEESLKKLHNLSGEKEWYNWNKIPTSLIRMIAEDLVSRPNNDIWIVKTKAGNTVAGVKVTEDGGSRIEFYVS